MYQWMWFATQQNLLNVPIPINVFKLMPETFWFAMAQWSLYTNRWMVRFSVLDELRFCLEYNNFLIASYIVFHVIWNNASKWWCVLLPHASNIHYRFSEQTALWNKKHHDLTFWIMALERFTSEGAYFSSVR